MLLSGVSMYLRQHGTTPTAVSWGIGMLRAVQVHMLWHHMSCLLLLLLLYFISFTHHWLAG